MPLSQEDIKKWSRRGDPLHAWYSYEMVRGSLTARKLGDATVSVYPQGSYANKTNIADNSDVDIVVSLKSSFYPDKSRLIPPERNEYGKYYEQADSTWHDFHDAVCRVLRRDFLMVHVGTKAVKVSEGPIRLPADVLITLDHRDYSRFPSFEGQVFETGVQFYASRRHKIVNYPKQHLKACAEKDSFTSGNYRAVVRVAKNARNALVADDDSSIERGIAPSYFLEALLWNVPNGCFDGAVENAYPQAIRWLRDHTGKLETMDYPNGMGRLFGHTADTSWSRRKAEEIIAGLDGQLPPR